MKKYEVNNEIKLGKIYTTLGQKKPIKYKTASVHKGKINNNKNNFNVNTNSNNNYLYADKIDINKNFNNKEIKENEDELNIENLLLKKMEFDNQVKEIKKFINK